LVTFDGTYTSYGTYGSFSSPPDRLLDIEN